MTLLMRGWGPQPLNWFVDEPVAAGYSRIYFLEKGSILYSEGGITQSLSPGRWYLFPASMPYSMRPASSESLTCLWLHADLFPIVQSTLLELPQDPILESYANLLHLLFCEEQQEADYTTAGIHSFMGYLKSQYLTASKTPLEDVIHYIRENFRNSSLNINAISAHFGYTPEYFIRLFSHQLGITPYQYLLNMRMYEARRLLLSHYSVNSTAARVGYDNPRTFSHAFHKKYGIPPGEFRRRFSQLPNQTFEPV